MELTKTKLNNILKKYRLELVKHNNDWKELCRKKCKSESVGDKLIINTPSIYDHERHNSKGAQLFKNMMKEFDGYEVFPKKDKSAPKEKTVCNHPYEFLSFGDDSFCMCDKCETRLN